MIQVIFLSLLVSSCLAIPLSARQSCSNLMVADFSTSLNQNNLGLYQGDDSSMSSVTISSGALVLVSKTTNSYWYTNFGCPATVYTGISFSITCQGTFALELQAGSTCGAASSKYLTLSCPSSGTISVSIGQFGTGIKTLKALVFYGFSGSATIDNISLESCGSGTTSSSTTKISTTTTTKVVSSSTTTQVAPSSTNVVSSSTTTKPVSSSTTTKPSSATSSSPTSTALPWYAGTVFKQCHTPGQVAITFDDGLYIYETDLINTLDRLGVQGTFFVNGNNWAELRYNVDVLKDIYSRGHQIASHTWSHPHLPQLSPTQVKNQMTQLETAFKSYIGVIPTTMRPPFLEYDANVLSVLKSLGYAVIDMNLDSLDWELQDVQAQFDYVQEQLQGTTPLVNSFIMLDHSTVESTVYGGIEKVILDLKARGYTMVTVADCIGVPAYR